MNEIEKRLRGEKTGLFFPPKRGLPHNSTSIVWAENAVIETYAVAIL